VKSVANRTAVKRVLSTARTDLARRLGGGAIGFSISISYNLTQLERKRQEEIPGIPGDFLPWSYFSMGPHPPG